MSDRTWTRHWRASTRFIPKQLLALFETATWPVVTAAADARLSARPGVRVDIHARARAVWQ